MNGTIKMTAPLDPTIGEVQVLVTVRCPECGGDMHLYGLNEAKVECPDCEYRQAYPGRSGVEVALRAMMQLTGR